VANQKGKKVNDGGVQGTSSSTGNSDTGAMTVGLRLILEGAGVEEQVGGEKGGSDLAQTFSMSLTTHQGTKRRPSETIE
jgi:hypothetical protein